MGRKCAEDQPLQPWRSPQQSLEGQARLGQQSQPEATLQGPPEIFPCHADVSSFCVASVLGQRDPSVAPRIYSAPAVQPRILHLLVYVLSDDEAGLLGHDKNARSYIASTTPHSLALVSQIEFPEHHQLYFNLRPHSMAGGPCT